MTSQLTLKFEPGLADRHKSLRECMVSCIYQRGLSNVADDLGKSPGNLSAALARVQDQLSDMAALVAQLAQAQGVKVKRSR